MPRKSAIPAALGRRVGSLGLRRCVVVVMVMMVVMVVAQAMVAVMVAVMMVMHGMRRRGGVGGRGGEADGESRGDEQFLEHD